MTVSYLITGFSDKYICKRCLGKIYHYFKNGNRLESAICSYCERRTRCLPVQDLVERVADNINAIYKDDENDFVFEDYEGESTYDIINEALEEESISEELREDIISCLNSDVNVTPCNGLIEHLDMDHYRQVWGEFANKVKLENPYLSLLEERSNVYYCSDVVSIANCFYELCQLHHVIHLLPRGSRLFRVRNIQESMYNNDILQNASELGAAPGFFSKKGTRMAPAGVGYFYASEDRECAIKEAIVPCKNTVTIVGEWRTVRDIRILDAAHFPNSNRLIKDLKYCSVFCEHGYVQNELLSYLLLFSEDVSRRVKKNEYELDYRPTQMLCAFLIKNNVNGIMYESSRLRRRLNFCGFWDYHNQNEYVMLEKSEVHNIC